MKILKFSSYFHHAKNKAKTNELKATLNNNFLRAIQKMIFKLSNPLVSHNQIEDEKKIVHVQKLLSSMLIPKKKNKIEN